LKELRNIFVCGFYRRIDEEQVITLDSTRADEESRGGEITRVIV